MTFTETLITIHDVLAQLNNVEDLTCGYQLEEFLCREREAKGILPKLKILNGIDVDVINMDERNKMHDAMNIMEKLPLVAGSYVLGAGMQSQAVWYLNDEVGSVVAHSD